jgi:cytochrome c peroxidase
MRPILHLFTVPILLALCGALHSAPLDEPIKPIPRAPEQNAERVRLGRLLFNDVRLSVNDRVSCASCHDLRSGGVDHRDRSIGFGGKLTAVNAPTVFNAALNFRQFWNGRAESLEAQIDQVVQNPVEMGSSWQEVIAKLSRVATYRSAFAAAYPNGLTKPNIQNAIATFERTLITPGSRFDRYLLGDERAISAAEKQGYARFKEYGCVACHQGVNVGGNMFQRFGVMGAYFQERGGATDADLGRYQVTRREGDRNVFKVPSLRNVAETAPYFHDASARTLQDAVDTMFKYQLGRIPSNEDRAAIVSFLRTLTADLETTS